MSEGQNPFIPAGSGSFQKSKGEPLDVPGLKSVLDGFANAWSKQSEPLLCMPLACSLEGAGSRRLIDAVAQSRGRAVATLFIPEKKLASYVIFDEGFGWMMVEAVLGERTSGEPSGDPLARVSSVSSQFVVEAARVAAKALASSFGRVASLNFRFDGVREAGDSLLLDLPDISVMETSFLVRSTNRTCRFAVLLPEAMIAGMRQELTSAVASAPPVVDPKWARDMEGAVSLTMLEVRAVLEELQISLGAISDFKVGQTIELTGSGMGKVRLYCNDQELFQCRVQENGQRYELVIH